MGRDARISPVTICFIEQNPISQNYLSTILRKQGFRIAVEKDASQFHDSSATGLLVLVVDEKLLEPLRLLSMRSLRVRFPHAKILILATHHPSDRELKLLRGVDGYVLYSEAHVRLAAAIFALRDGRMWFPREVLESFAHIAPCFGEKDVLLTTREAEVISLIEEGLSNKEIGVRLGIAEKTVKFHASNCFAKFGVHDRNSAVELAHCLRAANTSYHRR